MDNIVVGPRVRVLRYSQVQAVVPGEIASEETLRAHVQQGIGQSVEPAVAHVAVERPREGLRVRQRGTFRIDEIQMPDFVTTPLLVDSVEWNRGRVPAQRAPQRVAPAPRAAATDDGLTEGLQPASEGGSVDAAEPGAQFGAAGAGMLAKRSGQILAAQFGHGAEWPQIATNNA